MRPFARTTVAPALLAALLAGAYLVLAPSSQDLAAAEFRADLFADHGFVLWNTLWYEGHHLLSYSVLFPPFGALLGSRLTAALAVVAAAALFGALAGRRYGARALVPALWFAAGVSSWLLTGRVPFLLAVPFGLGALLAVDTGRLAVAVLLAAGCSLASPVAGLFLALAGGAVALAGEWRRGAWLAAGAAVPILLLNFAFPVGGEEPFVFSAFVAIPLLAAAVLWLVPAEQRALRLGVALYALLALAVFVVPNPLGGNVTRLGALFAGPVLALVLWPRGRLVVLAISIPLLYWQLIAPVRDLRKGDGDPAVERAFFEPLVAELGRRAAANGDFRLQIPPTENRWEAAYVAPHHPLARGWLRQLESDDFDLFTDGSLDAESYRRWLAEHGVGYVAVPDAELDYLAEDEVALIDAGLPYLQPVWSSPDWRLYRFAHGAPSELGAAGVSQSGPDGFTLTPGRRARTLPLRWTPYWEVTYGEACLEREGEWTMVTERGGGPVTVRARFSLDAMLGRDHTCSG